MRRFYHQVFTGHFQRNRQMLFVMGPRQVGKTTLGVNVGEDWPRVLYYTWDDPNDRDKIQQGGRALGQEAKLGLMEEPVPLLIFDEIHRYPSWKLFLKGLYDLYPNLAHILVTGGARLDVYQKGGDSLMGRYFRHHVHPFTIRELVEPEVTPIAVRPAPCEIEDSLYEALWRFGGFPDPLLRGEEAYHTQWSLHRWDQLLHEDLRDLTRIREISQMELLIQMLRAGVGSLTSYASLARKVQISHTTVMQWLKHLISLYVCFEVRPYAHSVARSLLKEPKYYLTDWSLLSDPGARAENMVACFLLKATDFWTDCGMGVFTLHYVRDKEKREVDFLVTYNGKPWMLVEVKLGNSRQISPSLAHFQMQLRPQYALQVVFDQPYSHQTCFLDPTPRIVSARSFLSQLV
ncbi:MAG: ATP-binding protein [Candidatus Obscuribacterales bacterium]